MENKEISPKWGTIPAIIGAIFGYSIVGQFLGMGVAPIVRIIGAGIGGGLGAVIFGSIGIFIGGLFKK